MGKKSEFKIILFVSLLTVSVFCFAENLLAASTSNKNKEMDYGDTCTKGGRLGPGGFLQENFNAMVIDGYGGKVRWKNNSRGFRNDYEIQQHPNTGIIRIISMGDSFTAGYRVGQESTFSALLEKYFNNKKDGNKYEILISCVEDPVHGLYYLSKYGITFYPKVIILGLTLGNDIAQSYIGLDRNSPQIGFEHGLEKYLIPKQCLADEATTNSSKISATGESIISCCSGGEQPRLFDSCNGLGMYIENAPFEINEAYIRLFRIIEGFKMLADKFNIELILVLFPQRFQIQKEDWSAAVQKHHLKDSCFDLRKPNNLILDFCKKYDIKCIDPTSGMTQSYGRKRKSLYFPFGDMHFNRLGHKALYESIKDEIYELIRNKRE